MYLMSRPFSFKKHIQFDLWTYHFLKKTFVFLILDDEECIECEVILESLENIDDEADLYGIDFVKNDDPATAKHFHIYNTPALVYFR